MTAAVIGLGLCVVLMGALVAHLARRVARLQRANLPAVADSRPRPSFVGAPAPAVVGVDPTGRRAAAGGERVLLAFLTGSCHPCQAIWASLREGRRPAADVVVVTPSPTTESAKAVQAVAGGVVPVVMSSEAWLAYGVRGAPWFALVVDGTVAAEGPAGSWEELEALTDVS